MESKYKRTLAASYIGYVAQAIVNNLAPLLFIIFQESLGLSLGQLTGLITLNFGVQLCVDAASTLFVDKIGYKATAIIAHILCAAGLVCMGVLPGLLPSACAGLLVAIVINAIGGGLIEVIISPIVEALPTSQKAASMSLLHSFYCWGYVAVVLGSTLFFTLVGTGGWRWLCGLWALVPLAGCLLFATAPVKPLLEEGTPPLPLKKLFTKKVFLLVLLGMVCAGASEQAMSQWASLFAESGLGVSKTMGDLLGPCTFAVLMGIARLVLGSGRLKASLESILAVSGLLCVGSYLLAVLAPHPVVALVGCGLCGLAVGCMWPAMFSLAAERIPTGGTAMFALFALAGDVGCAGGPSLVGLAGSLKTGLALAIIFPLGLIVCVTAMRRTRAGC